MAKKDLKNVIEEGPLSVLEDSELQIFRDELKKKGAQCSDFGDYLFLDSKKGRIVYEPKSQGSEVYCARNII